MTCTNNYKIILMGDTNTGKSTIFYKYFGMDSTEIMPTRNYGHRSKQLRFKDKILNLQTWDTSGHQKFRTLLPMLCRGTSVAIIVFSLDNNESFKNVEYYMDCANKYGNSMCHKILVGTKLDLVPTVDIDDINKLIDKYNTTFIPVTYLSDTNTKEIFDCIIDKLLIMPCNTFRKDVPCA